MLLSILILFFRMRYIVLVALFSFMACQSSSISNDPWNPSDYHLKDEALQLDLVANEPLINAPIALDIDQQGRYWVLEMPDYMPDIDAATENIPQGRIVILSDSNGDGVMDNTSLFLDQLNQPRALALVYGGLLYAEAPNLYFVSIDQDTPGPRILVDSAYAVGGNVEHQPNGLLYNIDNWIYSAKGRKRYRKVDDKWEIEATSYRGQWGITNDPYGRLYYNDNSNGLYGDYVLPNTNFQNPYLDDYLGITEYMLRERDIYPIHATSINRGYVEGALEEDGRVKNMTSACGPYYQKSNTWPEDYVDNAFISIPEGNLIKRVKVTNNKNERRAYNFYKNEDWLTSTDPAFRPVNMYEDFNGDLLVVDFHRGIIQHKTYMTNYLREKIIEEGLDTIYGYGRILKISPKSKSNESFSFQYNSESELIALLDHVQYRVRIEAQKEIVHKGLSLNHMSFKEAIKDFSEVGKIHGLHCAATLYKNQLLNFSTIVTKDQPWLTNHFLAAYANVHQTKNSKALFNFLKEQLRYNQIENLPYLAFALGKVDMTLEKDKIEDTYKQIIAKDTSQLVLQMAISGKSNNNASFYNLLSSAGPESWSLQLETIQNNQRLQKKNNDHLTNRPIFQDDKTTGIINYNKYCASCHHQSGEGIKNLAPSLKKALLVEKGAAYIAASILGGVKGKVTIDHATIEFAAHMPGLIENANISDQEIADIANYVTNALRTLPIKVDPSEVTKLRTQISSRKLPLTEAEIIQIIEQ